ncbi:GNAT family N-acetyltransferase [Streptomyces sp. MST-110588]|uniref:GNAT family N-acetyltransferase n=1 Tax=Streptomyces sp. MST-110588 TaxID=2833628 RepID=UPI001F5E24E5|nr:GNAT family N-acetyltransferase [Streptomyces sp. MST-110588]UNO40527.1 GNAT family N-acetyltransferase [Streptomyces sp. MST-110588]
MNHEAMVAEFDEQVRRNARPDGPGAHVERVGDVVRQTGPDPVWNGVLWSGFDGTDGEATDAAIAEQVRYFTALGREFEWKLYAYDRPGDLAERLEAAGFTPEQPETLMIARISDLSIGTGTSTDAGTGAGTGAETRPPEGITLRQVTDAAGVDLMADVHDQAFGTDGTRIRQQLLAQLTERPDTVVAVIAMAGDVPVSSARMELLPGSDFAGLWGGGTVSEWRGRGIYRALIDYRARIAAERGYRYLQVDASSQSRPILERLGFAPLTTTTPYLYRPRLS